MEQNSITFRRRVRDLEQLEQVAGRFPDRVTFLTEITLDPPASTQELPGDPHLDEDYLILSTIHSAKGLEWDTVYVIHAADGNIPADNGHKVSRVDRRRAAIVLRRADTRAQLALRLPSAAILLPSSASQ